MILYGASGHGKVVKSASIEDVVHFFDDNQSFYSFQGLPVSLYNPAYLIDYHLVLTIGDNKIRKQLTSKIRHIYGKVIAGSAILDSSVKVGKGSQILHNSVVQADSIIGNHVIINTSASIDHDCIIADYSHIAPNATLCGNVKIGEGTLVGAGAVIMPGINIGSWCKLGAGTVVTKNIPDYSTVVGIPAKIIKTTNG